VQWLFHAADNDRERLNKMYALVDTPTPNQGLARDVFLRLQVLLISGFMSFWPEMLRKNTVGTRCAIFRTTNQNNRFFERLEQCPSPGCVI
jgi:hypothetical protein